MDYAKVLSKINDLRDQGWDINFELEGADYVITEFRPNATMAYDKTIDLEGQRFNTINALLEGIGNLLNRFENKSKTGYTEEDLPNLQSNFKRLFMLGKVLGLSYQVISYVQNAPQELVDFKEIKADYPRFVENMAITEDIIQQVYEDNLDNLNKFNQAVQMLLNDPSQFEDAYQQLMAKVK